MTLLSFRRYSVKTIIEKQLFQEAIINYNRDWTIESLASHKQPLILAVSGSMKQQPTERTFLGVAVEEKFHLKAVILSIIPCVPLVSNRLKGMVHPSLAPVELSEGLKDGYFLVDLSKKQDFEKDAEFHFTTEFKPQETEDVGNNLA